MSSNSASSVVEKDRDSLWYFTSEQLANSPSRRHGIDSDQELSYRQMTAYLIQEMGQRLQVSQLCINTAIVYMHRFYAFHSFTHFHRNGIAAASLFLAAKVEEQPRKLEHVIKASNKCLNQPTSSTTDAYYSEQAQDLVFNENVLLQTLGFDVAIDHPHTHVVKTCQLVKACKDLAQTSYFLASNSLHLTSMCLQYKPTVVACFCIYLACKWSRWEIPQSTEGKHWFYYVDKSVTMELLKQLTDEFIGIYEKSPARLKSKLNTIKAIAQGAGSRSVKDKKSSQDDFKMAEMMKMYHSCDSNSTSMHGGSYSHNPVEIAPSNLPPLLLPPPPQQIRKLDTHSQIRSHANTSSHHNKGLYSSTESLPDLKTNHKQSFNGAMIPRPRDHPHTHQQIATNVPRGSIHGSSSRSNSSNLPIQPPPRSSLQSHHTDIVAQKFRERSNALNLQNPISCHISQKTIPKLDVSRCTSKEQLSKVPDSSKQSVKPIHQNTNMVLPQFNNSQIPPCPQAATKIDSVTDVLRNNSQNQRSYHGSNGRSNTISQPYQQQIDRTSHTLYTIKPEQQKGNQSYPMQHKQFPSVDTFLPSNTDATLQTQPHNHGIPPEFISLRPSENQQLEEHNHPSFTSIPQPSQAKDRNLFSPDWKTSNTDHSSDSFVKLNSENFAFKPSTNFKESPKKHESERLFDSTLKREKQKAIHTNLEVNRGISQQQQPQLQQKSFNNKKQDILSMEIEQPSTSLGVITPGLKRPIETLIKHEDSNLHNTKIRKVENNSTSQSEKSIGDINKLHVVNGIETNPDLVKNLLKESLCATNYNLLNETPTSTGSIPVNSINVTSEQTLNDIAVKHESGRSEKKKKKEKHKHKDKEKDKPKDKEERKKHKKDKDKHKDRDRESGEMEPVKIKITKEKVENPHGSVEPPIFKIKIPKERIIGDLNMNSLPANSSGSISHATILSSSSTPALKIKISKDKVESYTSVSATQVNYSEQSTHGSNQPYLSFMSNHHTKSSSHGSSKKKDRDRDRDRDKDKKRNSHEHQRSHSNNNSAGTFKIQHPNK